MVAFIIQVIGSVDKYRNVQWPAEQYFGVTEARLKLTMDAK